MREQYFPHYDSTEFLETRSLHIAVAGASEQQRNMLRDFAHEETQNQNDETISCFKERTKHTWMDHTALYDLPSVHKQYCSHENPLTLKSDDKPALKKLCYVRTYFQSLMSDCADEVTATHEVFKVLFPEFKERFPHPVTPAGMLELSTPYLPTQVANWQKYIRLSNETFDRYQQEMNSVLKEAAEKALLCWECNAYEQDLWLWDLDWTSVLVTTLDGGIEEVPAWFRKLCPTPRAVEMGQQPGQPCKFSSEMRVKLLRLTWNSFPLHKDKRRGWGYLIPYDDDSMHHKKTSSKGKISPSLNGAKFPVDSLLEFCQSKSCSVDDSIITKCRANQDIDYDDMGIPGVRFRRLPPSQNDFQERSESICNELFQRVYTDSDLLGSDLDADVHPGREVQLLQIVDGLCGRVDDVEQTLVRPALELLHGLLVHVR